MPSNGAAELGAKPKPGKRTGPAKVEVAVAKAKILGGLDILLDGKGRCLCRIEYLEPRGRHFDFPRGDIGIDRAFRPGDHPAGDLQDEFAPNVLGQDVGFPVGIGIEYHLDESFPVP